MENRHPPLGRHKRATALLPAALLASIVLSFDLWNLRAILHVLRTSGDSGDSWNPMRAAWIWFTAPHQGTLYQQIFFIRHIKFQYPLSSLLIFRLAALFHFEPGNHFLNWIDFSMFCLEAAIVGYVAYLAVQKLSPTTTRLPRRASWIIAIAAALLTLDFGPTLVAAALGQVQTWINTWFVLACLCWIKDRRFQAGICIGAICIFKPQFALFLLWGAVRKERTFLYGWATVVFPITAIALVVFGIANHLDYLPALQFMSRHGEVYYTNQSMNGLLNRFLGNGNSAILHLDQFPPFHPLVYTGTMVSSLLLIATALLYRARSRNTNAMDLSIAGLTFTLASPIAWNHHYGFMPIALLLIAISVTAIASPRKQAAAACALVIFWALEGHWSPPPGTFTTGPSTLAQSTLFLASLGALAMLYWLRETYAHNIAPRLEGAAYKPKIKLERNTPEFAAD